MNLLLINYEFPPLGGGASNATYHIGKCMSQSGHRVFVLTSGFGTRTGLSVEDGINVYRCPVLRRKKNRSNILEMFTYLLSAAFYLPEVLRKSRIEVTIVFFSFPCGPLGLCGKKVFGVPYLLSLRGGDVPGNEQFLNFIHRILKPFRRSIIRESLATIANSEGLKKLSEEEDHISVKLIPNGVDADFFKPKFVKGRIKRFLFVGRLQRQKNLFFLFEQMEAVNSMVEEPFELHLVGEGPLEDVLKKFCRGLKLRKKIFWHGWCEKEELRNYYQQADCIINVSFNEGMSNVLLEAMASGLAVVASNVAGNNNLVKQGETGFLFDLRRPEEFREAILRLVKDKNLSQEMGRRGRQWAVKEFSWEKVAEEYLLIAGKNFN